MFPVKNSSIVENKLHLFSIFNPGTDPIQKFFSIKLCFAWLVFLTDQIA